VRRRLSTGKGGAIACESKEPLSVAASRDGEALPPCHACIFASSIAAAGLRLRKGDGAPAPIGGCFKHVEVEGRVQPTGIEQARQIAVVCPTNLDLPQRGRAASWFPSAISRSSKWRQAVSSSRSNTRHICRRAGWRCMDFDVDRGFA
jgi:hypothetical protein